MRLVFAGTAEFAVPSLRACNARHEVLAAVTQPARPGSRGRPAPRPVADAAGQLGVPLLQPERIRSGPVVEEILGLGADVLVVAAYGQILPRALLDGHRFGGVNVHASLLPRWRGAAPIARAILAGDPSTGVCIMRMEAGLDTGPVYARRELPIGADATAAGLTETLAIAGAEELVAVLAALERGTAAATPQPEDGVTYAARLTREDGLLDWPARTAAEVDRMVRALTPWPGVTGELAGAEVRILAGRAVAPAEAEDRRTPGSPPNPAGTMPGSVVRMEGESAVVATAAGLYRVDALQPPGRRAMSAAAFLRGRR
ncbi:MAG: methionyl-tRNA formyltransferase [Candidatus Dormibacteria bacterium]|jgi:methionyl-tRNA formyltransferase